MKIMWDNIGGISCSAIYEINDHAPYFLIGPYSPCIAKVVFPVCDRFHFPFYGPVSPKQASEAVLFFIGKMMELKSGDDIYISWKREADSRISLVCFTAKDIEECEAPSWFVGG